MSYERITKKSHPKTWELMKKALLNYRKRSATLHIQDDVSLTGRYWDGGSKTDWILTKNGTTQTIPPRSDFPFTTPDKEVDLTDGTIAISTGTFCGKSATASVYMCKAIELKEPIQAQEILKELYDFCEPEKEMNNDIESEDTKINWCKHER